MPAIQGTPAPIYMNLSHLGGLSYTWVINSRIGNAPFYSSGSYGQIEVYNGACINVTCTVATACGNTSVNFVAYRSNGSGGYYMSVYPNSASEELTLTVLTEETANSDAFPVDESKAVKINDKVKLINNLQIPMW
ncbi:MAG: hypothetical protein NW226_26590 [Microscillaceae bacterium]|nr:hypothetical protein [Microscillaceae bacterium]